MKPTATDEVDPENTINSQREKPYLSIVVPSRNDDHGGNTLRRMQIFFSGLLEQLEKYRIDSELILVDWNPPTDRPLLKDAIKWPDSLKYCTIRGYVVPPSIHQRYKYWDKIPFHFSAANNCGIKRARGEFILPAGIDLLYSDDLMSYIAAKDLKRDERYRTDRCDVDRNVVQYDTLKEQLDYCQNNIILVKARPTQAPWWIRWTRNDLPNLHTSAAGDFQLMSRHYWHLLRGFREADIGNASVDGLFCFMAYAAGVKEVILNEPMRLYHIDHDDKHSDRTKRVRLPFENWLSFPFLPAWLNNKIAALYRRLLLLFGYKLKSYVYDGVPTLGFLEYRKMARDMVAGKRPYILNDENWGLGREALEEFVISTADWDKEYNKD